MWPLARGHIAGKWQSQDLNPGAGLGEWREVEETEASVLDLNHSPKDAIASLTGPQREKPP